MKMYDLTRKSNLYVIFEQSYSQYSVVMAAILNFDREASSGFGFSKVYSTRNNINMLHVR